jgi:DNA-binding response OmpR family regulator
MPLSVLVIEDDDLTRLSIVYMLDALKYHVVDAKNVDSALTILAGVQFDIVVVSLARNDPDGALFAQEAKLLQPLIKIVVVSGRREQATLNGLIDGFVQKPFSLSQIDEAIKTMRTSFEERAHALARR